MIDRSYLIVACSLQGLLIAHLAVLIGIARNRIQGITIGQLCLPECLKLFGTRMQFELGSKHLFHKTSMPSSHRFVKRLDCVKYAGGNSSPRLKTGDSLPPLLNVKNNGAMIA